MTHLGVTPASSVMLTDNTGDCTGKMQMRQRTWTQRYSRLKRWRWMVLRVLQGGSAGHRPWCRMPAVTGIDQNYNKDLVRPG